MNRFERHPVSTLSFIIVIFLVVFIAMLEIALRYTALGDALLGGAAPLRQPASLVIRTIPPNSLQYYPPPEVRKSSGDPLIERYPVETDADGFILPGRVHSAPDVTIAFLGGSTTENMIVQPQNRFPALVREKLEAELGLKVNVINASRSGNNTQLLQLILQGKVLPLRPDIVVMMENANDLGVLSSYGTYWNGSSDYALVRQSRAGVELGFRMIRDSLIGQSYMLYRQAVRSLRSSRDDASGTAVSEATAPAGPAAVEQWAQAYEASLTQFVNTIHAWGLRPMLMTQVSLEATQRSNASAAAGNYLSEDLLRRRGFSASSFDNTHAYFNQIARHVAASYNAGLIDLAGAGGWNGGMVYDGLHFSDPGSVRAAEIITPALAAEIRALRSRKPVQ